MQLVALRQDGTPELAPHAHRDGTYSCPECGGELFLRRGARRYPHFAHRSRPAHCRQKGKSMEHLQVQLHMQKCLGEEASYLEHSFPAISRISDLYWPSARLVFEVQCSSITAEEIAARECDYSREGCRVVWILHTRRFLRSRLTVEEEALRTSLHYYTDIDAQGRGTLFDHWSLVRGGRRIAQTPRLPIDISSPCLPSIAEGWPKELLAIAKQRTLSFAGDLLSLDAAQQLALLSRLVTPSTKSPPLWLKRLLTTYQALLLTLLERESPR